MADASCILGDCKKEAPYRCPRCEAYYCSVKCYRAHSETCVNAFAHEANRPLVGVKPTEHQRTRFNKLLNNLRNAPEWEALDTTDLHAFESSDTGQSEEPSAEDENNSNEPHVLEELIDSLDEAGRDALFTVLHSAMERACGSESPPNRERGKGEDPDAPNKPQRTHTLDDSAAKTGFAIRGSLQKTEKQGDRRKENTFETRPEDTVTVLEELVEDMEEREVSYDEILSRLPSHIVDEFHEKMKQHNLHETLKPWTPWWCVGHRIEEQVTLNTECADEQYPEPAALPPLPKKSDLLVTPEIPQFNASPYVINSVIDVLASICLTLRLHDGDCLSDASHAARTMWNYSSVLSSDARYKTENQACWACVQAISETDDNHLAFSILQDVALVLGGSCDWVSRCLFYGQSLLQASLNEVVDKNSRKIIKRRMRKVGYLVAWSLCQPSSKFGDASRRVDSFVEIEQGRREELRIARRVVQQVK
ncbi:hypothetical protein BWQ96_08767 [Gracilariopsis chorda]|uniref:HIT-type domain-containing protein n=1 Tax=Gracilariopsis chorda TaxID=448386 RepID=A0A2V3IHE8_9FLOR|nr:hypothetical protein BWQ96_08767 [Gracilariopsis chorda]|eukprot:PXF41511.1 hypothetical protein BWQ96_08767 [Gracilariopsis chorda]